MHVPMEDLLLALYADYPADSCGTATLAQLSTLKAMHASRRAINPASSYPFKLSQEACHFGYTATTHNTRLNKVTKSKTCLYACRSNRIAFAYKQRLALLSLFPGSGERPNAAAALQPVQWMQACSAAETVTALCWVAWAPTPGSDATRHAFTCDSCTWG